MSNRELRAVAEAINDATGDFPYSIRYGNKLAQAAISASNSQYVKGLVEALSSIARNTCCDKCQEAALVARDALQKLPEDIR